MANVIKAKIEDKKLDLQVQQRALPASPANAQNIKVSELAQKPDIFDGKASEARAWIDAYERMAKANNMNEATMIKYITSFLAKGGTNWFITRCQPFIDDRTRWAVIRRNFITSYLGEHEHLVHRRKLQNTFQAQNESVSSFIPRTLLLFDMAYPDTPLSVDELIERLIEKMLPEMQEKLATSSPTSIEELNTLGLRIEQTMRNSKSVYKRQETLGAKYKQDKKASYKNKKQDVLCSRCERTGHLASKCFSSAKVDGSKLDPKTAAPKPPRKKMVHQIEHNDIDLDESTQDDEIEEPVVEIRRVCQINGQDKMFTHNIKLNDLEVNAMLDTGASISLIDESFVKNNGWPIQESKTTIAGADSQPIQNLGKVNLRVIMRVKDVEKSVKIDFFVVQKLVVKVLLGLEVLKALKVKLHLENMNVTFEDTDKLCREVIKLRGDHILKPRSISIVKAAVDRKGTFLTVPHQISPTLIGANSIVETIDHTIPFVLVNIDLTSVKLKSGMIVGEVERPNQYESAANESVAMVRTIRNTNETINVGDHLTETQLAELEALFENYVAAFSVNGKIGSTNLIDHKIELTENSKPFIEPHRRRPKVHVDEARRQVQLMLKEGIIEESNSPFASAYLLVKKKNGEMRMCIDFRRLNGMTKKCSFPLPNIEQCLDNLSGKKFFSQLDLASGFWQIPVAEESKEFTAFRTDEGLYHFKKMPFGLCNAPASFQKLVNILFSGLKGMNMQVFIDDICIATDSWREHVKMLAQVFELLIKANLKVKANKCTFGAREVNFLGHILSADGIKQDPNKLKAIVELPAPKNADELRRILGMMGYYRRFVANYAAISSPLTSMLKKNVAFKWEEPQQSAFDALLDGLAKNAVLKHFVYGKPTILKTDASKSGVGAIQQQRDENEEWRLVVCCSRRLTPAETNYGISDLEGLAIIYAVTKLRPYLLGHHFTILTDHCALCALNLKDPKSERLKRWAAILQSFDFAIKYVRGGLHRDVDCISRAPVDEAPDIFIDAYALAVQHPIEEPVCVVVPKNREKWIEEYASDPNFSSLHTFAERNELNWSLKNDVIYKNDKLYVPVSLRSGIIAEAHSEFASGHSGITATLSRISQHYWWTKMAHDVQEFVKACKDCQLRKAERQLPSGSMHHHNVIETLQMVAFDCLGPLPETLDGKKHIILAIDMFTRFIDAKAVERIDAVSFSEFLMSFIGHYGVPKGILTDNATTFINQHVTRLTKVFGFKHYKSTPHHSRGNSVAERAIQSLQEKLALLCGGDDANEWSAALPTAVLALNYTEHQSVGAPPFFLMFGRRPALLSNIADTQSTIYDVQANLIAKTLELAHAEAIARQSDAQAASRQYFDANHVSRSFEIGDLVLAKRMGRKAKLTSRFVGPFKVTSKTNDIYSIESIEGRQIRLSRHVKDLKAYLEKDKVDMVSKATIVATVLSLCAVQARIHVEEVSPVVWHTTRYYVSSGYTSFKLHYFVTDPCNLFNQFMQIQKPPSQDSVTTVRDMCHRIFTELIGRLHVKTQQGHPVVQMSRAKQPMSVVQVVNAGLAAQTANGIQPQMATQVQTGQILHHQANPQSQSSYALANGHNHLPQMPPSTEINYPIRDNNIIRRKRGLGDTVTGIWLSDIWETVRDAIWTNPQVQAVKDRLQYVDHTLAEMQASRNVTMAVQDALSGVVQTQADLIETNHMEIQDILVTHPALMLVTSDIIVRLHKRIDLLDRIRVSFRQKKPDFASIAQLLETDEFDDIDPDSVHPEYTRIIFSAANTITFEFAARRKLLNAQVLRVEPFAIVSNLTSERPSLFTYDGPPYLVYNNGNNCYQGIRVPENVFVDVMCNEANYVDDALSNWIETTVDLSRPKRSQRIENYPFVHILCYGNQITIKNVTEECPPFAFRLPVSEAWSTSDGVRHSPTVVELFFNITDVPYTKLIMAEDSQTKDQVHFKGSLELFDARKAISEINRLRNLTGALSQQSTAFVVWEDTKISFRSLFYSLSSSFVVFIIVHCALWYRRSRTHASRHKEIVRTMVDGFAGSGAYETIALSERNEKKAKRQSMIRELIEKRLSSN